jgi:hypothetical protein
MVVMPQLFQERRDILIEINGVYRFAIANDLNVNRCRSATDKSSNFRRQASANADTRQGQECVPSANSINYAG